MKDPEVPEPEALDNGGPALPGLVEPRKHRAHDFQKPRLLPEREVRALDTLHRKFARSLSSSLSVLARVKVQVDLSSVAQRSYFEFLRSLLSPTSLHLIYCFPGRIPFVAELSPTVLFPMIERLLGGKGEDPSTNSRPLTKIEQSLASSILSRLLEDLREAWAACPGLRFDCAETEHNPLLMQIVGPTEPSVIFCFQVSVGAKTGALHLAFPSKLFDPILAKLARSATPGPQAEKNSEGEKQKILRRLASTQLTASAELASVPILLQDVLALRAGDVIDTQLGRASEVSVLLEGRRVFRGIAASHQGRRAVKLTEIEA